MDLLKPVYLGNTANINDKRFVIFEDTINCISLGYVCLLQLEYWFFFFSFFLITFFSFSSRSIYFQTAKRIVFNEWLKISRKTTARLESGVPRYWSSKIFYFKSVRDGWMKFSEWVDVENKLNLKKLAVPQWGPSQTGSWKIQNFPPFKLDKWTFSQKQI